MNIVIGSRGQLGSAIAAALPPGSTIATERSVYEDWWREGAADAVARYLDQQSRNGATVFVAAGLLDLNRPAEEHNAINFSLPRQVVEGAARAGARAVTFGTVMEAIVPPAAANPYIASKQQLADFIEAFRADDTPPPLHARMHTLFGGGAPKPFMFLGQMLTALRARAPFQMSLGQQLREYHHIDG